MDPAPNYSVLHQTISGLDKKSQHENKLAQQLVLMGEAPTLGMQRVIELWVRN